MQRLKSSNKDKILKILSKVSLFSGLDPEDIEHLYNLNGDFYRVDTGEVFIREGAVETFFYVLLTGEVEVYKSEAPNHIICEISPGNFIGENSYFKRLARNANVRAKGNCVLMKVDAETVKILPFDVRDKIKDQIMLELVRRVGSMNNSQVALVDEVKQAQKRIAELESQMRRLSEEYPHIRMRLA